MEEKNLSETKLKGILEGILTDKARLALMGENLKNSKDNHPLAAREIIEVGQSVMKKG
jgi:UDP-N-acetylglucosamine:LPS N-acetylglucosamine transferase